MAIRTETREHVDAASARGGIISGDEIDRRTVINQHAKSSSPIGVVGWYRISGGTLRTIRSAEAFAHVPHPTTTTAPTEVGTEFERGPNSRPIAAVGDPAACYRLTRRERQVLQLVATGCTDREIGDLLCIGARTAEWHLANVFNKLGLSTRAAAAAYAVRHGIA